MPSASPSPAKRPSMQDTTSSTVSLSCSGKPAGAVAGATKLPRPHLVSRQSRNVSHGRPLSTMPKKSTSQVYQHGDGRQHRRAKSGTSTPSASPKTGTGGGGGGGGQATFASTNPQILSLPSIATYRVVLSTSLELQPIRRQSRRRSRNRACLI